MIQNKINGVYDYLWTKKKVQIELDHLKDRKFLKIANTYTLTKENKDAVDDFFLTNYGERIPYIWHQYFAAHTGIFDPRYFPNIMLTPYLEHYMNFNRNYGFVFEDKNVIPYIASCADVKMPRTVLSQTCGVMRDGDGRVVNEKQAKEILFSSGKVFCKSSTGACGGRGCFVTDFQTYKESIDNAL